MEATNATTTRNNRDNWSCWKKFDYLVWPAEKRKYLSDQHIRCNGFFTPQTHYLIRVIIFGLLCLGWIASLTQSYQNGIQRLDINPAYFITVILFALILISYNQSHNIKYRSISPFCLWKFTNILFPVALCWQVLSLIYFWRIIYPQLSIDDSITEYGKYVSYIENSIPLLFLIVDWCLNPVMFILWQLPFQLLLQCFVVGIIAIHCLVFDKQYLYDTIGVTVTGDSLLKFLVVGFAVQAILHFIN